MKKFLAIVVALAAATPLFAQRDEPDVNIERILRDLEEIEKKQAQTLISAKQRAFDQIRSAASSDTSAINFYEEAMRATQFAGGEKEMQKWLEWKNNNSEALRHPEMRKAVQMHLQYLLLSLKRFDAEDGKDFVKHSLDYASLLRKFQYDLEDSARRNSQMQQQQGGGGGGRTGGRNYAATGKALQDAQNILRQNVSGSMFARYLGLDPYLPKKDWENSSGNFRGILEKNVMAVYRTDKNPELMKMWDYIIAYEEERANPKNALDFNVTRWNEVQLPQLKFARANDYIAIDFRNRGIMEIFALIKQHPTHPDFANWIARLREVLTPKSKPAEPAAEASQTPEAAVTPAPAPAPAPATPTP